MSDQWIVLSERNAVTNVGDLGDSPEAALEVHYAAMKSITGYDRQRIIRVLGVLNLGDMDKLQGALRNAGFQLVPFDGDSRSDEVTG